MIFVEKNIKKKGIKKRKSNSHLFRETSLVLQLIKEL